MTAPIPWQEMTHQQLDAAVNAGPGPGISMAAEQTWRQVSEIIGAGEARMHAAVTGSGDGWQGSAGDAARSGLHELNSWARDAAMDAHNTVSAMIEQSVSAGRLRSSMPAPNTAQLDDARGMAAAYPLDTVSAQALADAEAEATWRAESAQRAMMGYYYHSLENRQLMDYWAVPPTVLVEAGPAGGSGQGGSGSGGPGSGGSASGMGGSGAGQVPAGLGAAAIAPDGTGGGAAGGVGSGGAGGAGAGSSGGSGAAGPGGIGTGGSVGAGSAGAGSAAPGPKGTGGIGGALGPGATTPGTGGATGTGGGHWGTAGHPGTAGPGPAAPGRPGTGAPGGAGSASPIRGPKDLPAGAGGRGTGAASGAAGSTPGGGVRPVVPRVPTPAAPSPTWRDLVVGQRGESGGVGGRPGDAAPGSRGGPGGGATGGGPGGGSASGTGAGLRAPAEVGNRAGAGGHGGMYPPMGAGGVGGQGEGRRRASFLVDDSGAFDVDLPCTEPVIGADLPRANTRTRGDAAI